MTPLTKIVGGVAVPLYYLRRVSDKFIINSRAVSNTTSTPNPGPDQEYIPIMRDPAPDYDPVFTTRDELEGVNETSHQVEITYSVKDRPKEDQKLAVDNARRFETSKHLAAQDATEALVLVAGALARQAKGLELTPPEKAAQEKIVAIAAKLQENVDISDAKKAIVDRGAKPDLSSNWATVAAATP